jgi:putative hemolysin
MLQFTEILPKSLGVRFNMEVARWIARPLSLGIMVLYPVTRLIHWVNRPFEFRRRGQPARATLEEITALAGLARLSNQIGPTQERIIVSAARLREMRVRQVMLPLDQIVFLSTGQDISEALVAAHIDAHTRYPVCEGQDRDRVVGYVNFKELVYFMRTNPNDPSFQGIIRPVRFANPDQSAADLLRTFINEHVHIAIVRDAQDKTLGLVTMEDLVEELLGELEDEFDRLPRMFDALSGGTWMVGGGTPISEVAKRLELDVADQQGTISAWLERRLGRKPAVGDEYQEAGSRFSVRRLRRGQAFEIVISRIAPGRGSESAEHAGRGGASP